MKRFFLFAFSFCLICAATFNPNSSFAQVRYTLEDLSKEDGLNLAAVDYFLNKNFFYTRIYPPRVESQAHRAEIEKELKAVITAMESKLTENPESTELLWRLGWVYTMTYNLDWRGSKEKIESYFNRLFELDPEHDFGHLYYGAHLSQTGDPKDTKKCLYHLGKAHEYGYDVALTMMGIACMQMEDYDKALEYFKKFQAKYPQDPQIKMLIEGIETSDEYTVHSISVDEGGKRTEKVIEK